MREKWLIYHSGTADGVPPEGIVCLDSTLQCLHMAGRRTFASAAVSFLGASRNTWNEMLELARLLPDVWAEGLRVDAIIGFPDPQLLAELDGLGGVRVHQAQDIPINKPWLALRRTALLPAEILKQVCPYITFELIGDQEILLCAAYRSLLVLGGPRLTRFCTGGNRERCPYFLNPRFKAVQVGEV